MDKIEAVWGLSAHLGKTEHLSVHVNGRASDEMFVDELETLIQKDFGGRNYRELYNRMYNPLK